MLEESEKIYQRRYLEKALGAHSDQEKLETLSFTSRHNQNCIVRLYETIFMFGRGFLQDF